MKKLIFIIVGGLLFFVLLIGIVFGILTFMEKSEKTPEQEEVKEIVTEENNSVLGLLLSRKQAFIDSLLNLNIVYNDSITNFISENDSLTNLNLEILRKTKSDSLAILKLQNQTAKLKADQQAQNEQANQSTASVKELAKTYEQMKINEMKPIFSQLDDQTIIDLYNAMSSRKKPMVIKALSTERAAKITKKLAK